MRWRAPVQRIGLLPTISAASTSYSEAQMRQAAQDAVAAGSQQLSTSLKWRQVEPQNGEYNFSAFLPILQESFLPLEIGIAAIDYDGTVADFDVPKYCAMLTQLHRVVGARLVTLYVGTETDAHFRDHPEDLPMFASFVAQVQQHARTLWPAAVVTCSFSYDAVAQWGLYAPLAAMLPVPAFTYYHTGPGFVLAPNFIADTWTLYQTIGAKPFIFSEVGVSSSEALGSSEAHQAAVLNVAFDVFAAYKPLGLRSVTWNWQSDWPDWLLDQTFPAHDATRAFIGTLGLKRAPDDMPKLAWYEFLRRMGRR